MANEKSTMHLATAKAVARVKEQTAFAGKWGTREHLACLRYLACDAFEASKGDLAKFNLALVEVFKADPELGYASNTQKLLVKCGEIEAETKSGGGYE